MVKLLIVILICWRGLCCVSLACLDRNVRNEIKKGKKVYFYDCGIRNAVYQQFQAITVQDGRRRSMGEFCHCRTMNYYVTRAWTLKQYFWRTTQQQEIDLIEEIGDDMTAYEIKWNPKERVRFSQTFVENYPTAKTGTISTGNF